MAEAIQEAEVKEEKIKEEEKPEGLLQEAVNKTEEKKEEAPENRDPISHIAPQDPKEDTLGKDEEEVEFKKPDYFPEKFWNDDKGPDVEELVKSYAELQKKFSQGKHKPPKEYETELLKEHNIDMEDELLVGYQKWSKENGISQEAFNNLAKVFLESGISFNQKIKKDMEEQKKLLGGKADEHINGLLTWGTSLKDKGVLSDSEFDEFTYMGGSALGIKVFDKIRNYYGEKAIPTIEPSEDLGMSKEEIKGMVADKRYGKDPSFTARVEKLFNKAFPGPYEP